jgi:hypothetical protein
VINPLENKDQRRSELLQKKEKLKKTRSKVKMAKSQKEQVELLEEEEVEEEEVLSLHVNLENMLLHQVVHMNQLL